VDDQDKSQTQLILELEEARRRVSELEAAEEHHLHVEKELERSRAKYRELVESVNSIILRMDPRGNLTFVNPFACDFFGYSESEILGKNVVGTIVPTVEDGGRDMVEHIRDVCEHAERHVNNENENIRRDGSRVWIAWTNRPLRDENGRVTEILCIGNDITEHKRMEEAVRASEKGCHDILDASSDTILLHDLERGIVLDCNRAMFDMYGYTHEEALHLTVDDLSLGESPYTAKDAEPLWRKAIAEGPQRFEWRCRRKSGELFWGEVVLQRVVLSDRERILAIVRDISQRRQAEQRIRQEQRMLRRLLDAQERERRLIAYEIHDGLAQQLAAAVMHLQVFDQLRDKKLDVASESHQAGQRALAEGLAETRRLISGLRSPVLDESGVVAAIEDLVSDARRQPGLDVAFSANVQFDRLDAPLENTLFRIVQESLTNARRYSQSDRIRIELMQEGDDLRLEIRDWGIGFDPKQVETRCFGLEGIRERATLWGGRAHIDTQPGEGTRIIITLPMSTSSWEDEIS
jgi:PAS domain S-box-containing protein